MNKLNNRYPKSVDCQGTEITLELLENPQTDEVRAFTEHLSDGDLLFLTRDIREEKVVAAWAKTIASGGIVSVAAKRGGEIVGTTAVLVDRLSWSAHVGDMRILVRPDLRDIGLGRILIQESFLIGLDLGLEKLVVRMTLDQDGAVAVFEEMGFRSEALLRDHVKDASGEKHDLLIMGHDVQAVQGMMQAYGLDEAF
ncbi:MAG: GNAT family N-acetyltransferase [Chloroflexota bacterium]|nr:GNAT family N-acetyltransferase [Chloroflexota bacterium]